MSLNSSSRCLLEHCLVSLPVQCLHQRCSLYYTCCTLSYHTDVVDQLFLGSWSIAPRKLLPLVYWSSKSNHQSAVSLSFLSCSQSEFSLWTNCHLLKSGPFYTIWSLSEPNVSHTFSFVCMCLVINLFIMCSLPLCWSYDFPWLFQLIRYVTKNSHAIWWFCVVFCSQPSFSWCDTFATIIEVISPPFVGFLHVHVFCSRSDDPSWPLVLCLLHHMLCC